MIIDAPDGPGGQESEGEQAGEGQTVETHVRGGS